MVTESRLINAGRKQAQAMSREEQGQSSWVFRATATAAVHCPGLAPLCLHGHPSFLAASSPGSSLRVVLPAGFLKNLFYPHHLANTQEMPFGQLRPRSSSRSSVTGNDDWQKMVGNR